MYKNRCVLIQATFGLSLKKKKGHSGIPGVVNYNGVSYDKPQDIVNAFAEHFKSTFKTYANVSTTQFTDQFEVFNQTCINLKFSEDDVLNAIKRLKNNSVSGVDHIPSFLVRDCSAVLAKPLFYIFNLCLHSSCFPDLWKIAKVIRVLKADDESDVNNYRAVSILCNFSKIFEIIIYDNLYNNIKFQLSSCQHGFLPGRSTLTNLICTSQNIIESLDKRCQLDVIYTDISKAFDRIDHSILLLKLARMGLSALVLKLLSSYLNGRQMFVEYNGSFSASFPATSGVPQGANLGPLLFIYFNDVVFAFDNAKVLLYADDLKLFFKIQTMHDCELLQRDINNLYIWCINNNLTLNIDKCKVVSYTRNHNSIDFTYMIRDRSIKRCSHVNDLGVQYDSEVSFQRHINDIVSKSVRALGFILRHCKNFDSKVLKTLYFSLVRSKLEYCSLAWFPYYNCQKLAVEKVQRRILKFLQFKLTGSWPARGTPQPDLLSEQEIESLMSRRILHALSFLYKLLIDKIDCQEILGKMPFYVPKLGNRYAVTMYVPATRTNVGRKAPIYVTSFYLRSIDDQCDIFNCSSLELRCAVFSKFSLNIL